MTPEPLEWNVVVVGAWNRAILTPQGISKRLFQLPPDAAVEVLVALDGLAPMRVVHGAMTVIPDSRQLIVQPDTPSLDGLSKAAEIATRAIASLPETPVTAAGINIRFRFSALPDDAIEAGNSSGFDHRLADSAAKVFMRTTKRSLRWNQADLNIEIIEKDDVSGVVSFNFHRSSSVAAELTEWIGQVAAMHEEAITLLRTLLGVKFKKEKPGE
jgi:hypothetical protein